MGALKNLKHEHFCREYIIDLNATQAYLRVYKPTNEKNARVSASNLLTKLNIQERIAELNEERSKRTEITADSVLADIVEIKDRCMQKQPVMEYDHDQKCMVPNGEWQFKENGALKACEMLGKHIKLFTEKIEVSGDLDHVVKVVEMDIKERIEQIKGKK